MNKPDIITRNQFLEFYNKGLDHFKNGEMQKAVQYWEDASKLDSNVSELYAILSNAYKMLEDWDNSVKSLEKAINLEPNNFRFLYNFALLLYEKADYKKSLIYMQKALVIEPNNYEILNDLGVINYKLNNMQKALQYLEEAKEINPKYEEGIINLFYVYLELKKFDQANGIINHLIKIGTSKNTITILKQQLEEININPKDFRIEFLGKSMKIEPLEMIQNFQFEEISSEIEISIVVPILNEEDNIPILYKEISETLSKIHSSYEIIFIDDGSKDNSLNILKELSQKDNKIKIIQFRRNYGQTAALSAGFKYAHGNIIITMDGDLQNDPHDIPLLLEKMSEGYDLVNGWRKNRKDKKLTRKIPSKIANKIINKLIKGSGIQLHDFGCTLKAYKRGIVKNIHLYGEMHRFIPVFAAWLGVNVTEIPVNHRPRIHGYAKYNLSRVSRVIFDLLVVRFFSDFMTRPIQFFGKIAKNIVGWGTLFFITLGILKYLHPSFFISYNTILILFGLLSLSGLQIIVMGLLGETIMRVYFESQKKDYYIVEKVITS